MLHEHARKTDPVDIANFAMMLHQREEIVFQDQEFMALRDEAKGYALKMLLQQNENARLRAALERLRNATPYSTDTISADGAFEYVHAVVDIALADQKGGMRYFEKLRMSWIIESIEIFGHINRSHVVKKFGVTEQVASKDFQNVQKLHPHLMQYDASAKTYFLKGSQHE